MVHDAVGILFYNSGARCTYVNVGQIKFPFFGTLDTTMNANKLILIKPVLIKNGYGN